MRAVDHVDIGGGIFFLEQGSRPEAQPRVYCLAPEKNPPLISTTLLEVMILPEETCFIASILGEESVID